MFPAETMKLESVMVPPDCYDKKRSRARVWMLKEREYRWVHSIDAKEYVFYGVATFYKPGEEPVIEPAAPRPEANTTPPLRDSVPGESSGGVKNPLPTYPFAAHTVEELRIFAEDAGIENYEELRKDRLVAALHESGYKPPQP